VAFFWELPWDHAAGLLLTAEAGGASLTASGAPFHIPGGNTLPFTVARDAATARRIAGLMAGEAGEAGTASGASPASSASSPSAAAVAEQR
jgi:fructose-1,6-bisphosphatase/inositol monophosphatase family enzyme